MNRPSEKLYGKQLVQEYEDLLNYCKADNRAFPINWYKVMEILETRKLPRHCWGYYDSLILGYWHHYNVEQKIERFAKGEKIDSMIISYDEKLRKINLSIKDKETHEEQAALTQYGSSDSGASLGDILGKALNKKTSA